MSNDVMKLEDIDGFDYESEYEDDDFGGGGMLAGTTRLKFTNSYEWVKHGSNEKMPAGLELLVAKVERVLIRFKGPGEAPDTVILEPGEKFPSMKKYNEQHVPKSEWKANRFTGELEGGWQSQHVLFLLNENTFDRYSWPAPCTTIGATLCIEDLLAKIKFKRKIAGETVLPIVTLSDTHMNTQYSKEGRQRPHLVLTGRWVCVGGGPALAADPEPKQLTASPPTAPAAPAALEHLARAAVLAGHNIQNYDLPMLKKLYGWVPPAGCIVRDTLILSRLIFPAIGDLDDIVTGMAKARGGTGIGQLRGRHSIEAWGQRFGLTKVGADIEDFSVWSAALQERCVADTKICAALWHFLQPDGYSKYAVELEHRTAQVCEAIEAAGVPFDVAGAQRLADRLRVRWAELREPLQAQFPDVNLNSNQQLIPLFESRGWRPSKRTEKTGQPKLGDEVLSSIARERGYPNSLLLALGLTLFRALPHTANSECVKGNIFLLLGEGSASVSVIRGY